MNYFRKPLCAYTCMYNFISTLRPSHPLALNAKHLRCIYAYWVATSGGTATIVNKILVAIRFECELCIQCAFHFAIENSAVGEMEADLRICTLMNQRCSSAFWFANWLMIHFRIHRAYVGVLCTNPMRHLIAVVRNQYHRATKALTIENSNAFKIYILKLN